MAKKKKKEEQSEFEFPEFDELAFIKKEFLSAKTTFIAMFFAAIMGCVSYYLAQLTTFPIGFIPGVLAMFGIKFVFLAFRIDVARLERKNWAGLGFSYFFTWLAVWVLLLNTLSRGQA